jgi:hypothetical protein
MWPACGGAREPAEVRALGFWLDITDAKIVVKSINEIRIRPMTSCGFMRLRARVQKGGRAASSCTVVASLTVGVSDVACGCAIVNGFS